MTYNDRAAARKALEDQRYAKLVDTEINQAVRELLETRRGRRLVWWLLGIGRAIGGQPFASDPHQTSFNCGEQNVGNQILSRLLETSPEGFINMQKEQQDEYTRRSSAAANANDSPDLFGDTTGEPADDSGSEIANW